MRANALLEKRGDRGMNTQFTPSDKSGLRRAGVGCVHWGVALVFACAVNLAHAVDLEDISFAVVTGEQVRVKLSFSGELPGTPTSFTIDDPARIALDFPGVSSALESKSQDMGVGVARRITAVEAADRTRVVVELTRAVAYDVEIDGSQVMLNIAGDIAPTSQASALSQRAAAEDGDGSALRDIDFTRGEQGEGRVVIHLADPRVAVDLTRQEGDIVVDFIGTSLPEALDRKLDVVDFATPVKEIDTSVQNGKARMRIKTVDDNYDYLAYQTDDVYMIEFRPLSKAELVEQRRDRNQYTGEPISLTFQSIEVRSLLQFLARFNNFNLVVSDTVSGFVTIELKNVPWDQAMDIVLKSKGLAQRKVGNVVMVAPQEEIAVRERLELETERQLEELSPLRTEYISINYADAAGIAGLIQAEQNSLLSERGSVAIDERTNTLIVQDIASSLEAVRDLITELDIPVRQVLIESRIVNADNRFSKDIGVRFGYSKNTKRGGTSRGAAGDSSPNVTIGGLRSGGLRFGDTAGDAVGTGFLVEETEGLMVDLPATVSNAGSLGLAIGKVGSYILQLELSALIAEGRGEEIANPRVITANQSEAVIESGVEIPYQEASSSGATSVAFKNATLSLRVRPQITPDDRVFMDLTVNQDTISATVVNGVPAINTKSVSSQVLVDNGETLVLGGIYSQTDRNSVDRVPFFGELPYVGFLFRRNNNSRSKNELLIFITPKILKEEFNI